MNELAKLSEDYPDYDEWRIVDIRAEDWPDGTTRIQTLAHLGPDGSRGFSIEEGVLVDPTTPYVMTWNLTGVHKAWSSRDEAIAYLIDFVERYEATHDIWTCDQVSLFHVKSESDVDLMFHAGLMGNLPPDEQKWGGFDAETRARAARDYARFTGEADK